MGCGLDFSEGVQVFGEKGQLCEGGEADGIGRKGEVEGQGGGGGGCRVVFKAGGIHSGILVMLIPSGGSTRDAEICDTASVKGYGPIYSKSKATKRKIKRYLEVKASDKWTR